MALQFILGPSGAGKSRYIFDEIIGESLKHPDRQYLLLVPEQYTMETQRVPIKLFDVRHSTISYTAPPYPTYRTVPMSIASTFCAASTTGMHRSFLTKSGTSFKATST